MFLMGETQRSISSTAPGMSSRSAARRASSPSPATTTTWAPAAHAAVVVDRVSSVFPEHETAMTSERGPTQVGSS